MYYSEFVLELIEEVKQHEILYNTKYERRPKSEKESAWMKISEKLNGKQF
jgi:Alcohol dehydrogenase transcription factor Myb/SANT-like